MTSGLLGVANTEDWRQVLDLIVALGLSAAIGLERDVRQKSAGLRTHTLVGIGAALFVLISKYGFSDVLRPGAVALDPSRMAAQLVTGIGFLGAGLIFVRSDAVRGLTTAAAVWVTAAIGAAAGADLPVLATFTTAVYFVVVLVFPPLVQRLPRSSSALSVLCLRYHDGRGVLREVLQHATARGFAVAEVAIESTNGASHRSLPLREDGFVRPPAGPAVVEVTLQVHGKGSVNELAVALSEVDGVESVVAGDANSSGE